ncbi:MAG TPA: twin-arginine translocase TatA/TatE family subunit [Gemmatimonadales bacterium]|nr:twin-arginine translocase TatA/TatE family subunit [Gemmatimonadales bacterium]
MFGNLGMSEILIILAIVLLIFGARRLPEIGAAMGKSIREFKRSMSEVTDEIERPAPPPPEPRRLGSGSEQGSSNREG